MGNTLAKLLTFIVNYPEADSVIRDQEQVIYEGSVPGIIRLKDGENRRRKGKKASV